MRGLLIASLFTILSRPIAYAGDGHDARPAPAKPKVVAPEIDVPLPPGFELGAPIREGHLWIYPIATTDTPLAQPYTTLQDGLDRGVVTVRETKADSRTVTITNGSKAPLLILRGELLVGGNQDRLTAIDWTIQPGHSETVAVYCAEAERVEGPTDRFAAGHAIAELSIRYAMDNNPKRAQYEIWAAIEDANIRERTVNPTNAYRFTPPRTLSGNRAAARDRILRQITRPDVVGFAVAIDDQLMGVHRFPTPAVYRKLAPMTLAGYTPSR